LSHRDLLALPEDTYEVCIDSTLTEGNLTFGEYVVPGQSPNEVLISCHICHPSLANDNLSGVTLATWLAKSLREHSLRYTYRFLFIPGTIGSITWLALNRDRLNHVKHGLVLTGVGDPGKIHYKKSRQGTAEIDHVAAYVLQTHHPEHVVLDFSPFGYDERQFCSPGFNLPVGSLMRTPHDRYPEYHTSADNVHFVTPASLEESYTVCQQIVAMLEDNRTYRNQLPYGEPQLGRRGIYRAMGSQSVSVKVQQMALLWVLNLSDGTCSLLDIAHRSGLDFATIRAAADILVTHNLLK
jgi:aminopeptidase-like protein